MHGDVLLLLLGILMASFADNIFLWQFPQGSLEACPYQELLIILSHDSLHSGHLLI